jgi:Putative DNA-binding domain
MRPERALRPSSAMAAARPSLASVQAALLSRITGQALGASALEPASLIRGDARASADERLAVYAFMYGARLAEALESQFPRLARLLGGDAFADLSADYLADRPSRHPSLREIGRALPSWLTVRRPGEPALAALAALEWARADVYDLADETAMTLEAARAFPAERFGELPLELIAAHRLVEVGRETEPLWDRLAPDEGEVPDGLPAPVNAGPGATLLVWRQEVAVYHRAVDSEERTALALVSAGSRFGVICDALLAAHGAEAAAARAFAWLSTWISDGLLKRNSEAEF